MSQMLKQIRPSPRAWELLLLLAAIALPYMYFMNSPHMTVAVLAGIYVMLGLSLNIIVGYAGLFQLGHAAFFGLGAYTAAILSIERNISILATIPIAALVAGLAAVIVTKPILHLRGDYLCIVTIAFGEIFRIAVTNDVFGITGGPNGLIGAGRPEFPLPWVEPVPLIVLAIILGLYLLMTRQRGLVVQWGGAALIALAYYLPPHLFDHRQLFVISIFMGFVVLIVGASLRGPWLDTRRQLGVLVTILAIFVLLMAVDSAQLSAHIDGNIDKYFNVKDPVTVLGAELTPVAFRRDARPYYFLVLGFIVITVVGMRRLQDSRLGRAWLYVREDQLAAESMGIDTTYIKMMAFTIGSAWAGVAGVLYAGRFTVVTPENFNFLQSVIMFCIVVLGGSGSIPGVLVGTLGMVVLPELLRDAAPTFLYEGTGPVIILTLLLTSYLYRSQEHRAAAALLGGAAVMIVLPGLLSQIAFSFPAIRNDVLAAKADIHAIIEDGGPVIILALLLARFLRQSQQRLSPTVIVSVAITAAVFLPALLLDEPALHLVGLVMALMTTIIVPRITLHSANPLPWVLGTVAAYSVLILAIGGELGPDLEQGVQGFRIMNWRDGLMGVAMVVMMVLRPAGIIPERRRGIVISSTAPTPDSVPVAAVQQTM